MATLTATTTAQRLQDVTVRRWIYAAAALMHVAVLLLGGSIVVRRWYHTLYNLRANNDADVLFGCFALLWPVGLGAIYLLYVRERHALLAAAVPVLWIAGVATGLALFNASLLPITPITIEGAPNDPAAPAPRDFTERRAAYVGIAVDWEQSALPGQTIAWTGYAVRVVDAAIVDSAPGLEPVTGSRYLIATIEATKRGEYPDGWPGARTGLEVTIDKVNIAPYRGWEVSVPADPVRPGWVEVDGVWQILPATDFTPQMPVPANGETIIRRFATLLPSQDPAIGSYDRVYVVVHADVERNCRMDPPDIEQLCTWQLFPWEVLMP